jgi:glycosyltransferase involved in cell wall biosynthesis
VTQPHGSTVPGRPPRVVLFRANAIDSDSRAKKFALTLARLGYDVHVLSAEDNPVSTGPRHLGPVTVHPVTMTYARRDVHKLVMGARRRRQFLILDQTPLDEYVTRIAELKRRSRCSRRRADQLRSPDPQAPPRPPVWAPLWLAFRLLHTLDQTMLSARRLRWRLQWTINVGYRLAWREWDRRKAATGLLATTRGTLPEVDDYATAFSKILDTLEPDVIHAHHPLVLGTAVRAARRRRAASHPCEVVYDARENFAGIPPEEQGNVRRHTVLVREEARYVDRASAVITVSEPIADVLHERYHLAHRPSVILNVPVRSPGPSLTPDSQLLVARRTVRDEAGLSAGTPLLVYSGAVSAARGIDVLIDAMAHLPGVHLALVTVPFPHPRVPALLDRAAALGAADRIHLLPPVGQDELLHYLSGADVAVHPMPGGSPNHDQALPNKLFEYLHAGLPLVVTDAKLMADFVRRNTLGEVFRSGDAAGLAEAVRRVLAPGRPRLSRDWLAERYSWQAQEEQIAALYDRVCPVAEPFRVPAGDLPVRFPDLRVSDGPVVADVPGAELESLESPAARSSTREPSSTP